MPQVDVAHWTRAVVSALGEVINDGVIHPEEKVKGHSLIGSQLDFGWAVVAREFENREVAQRQKQCN